MYIFKKYIYCFIAILCYCLFYIDMNKKQLKHSILFVFIITSGIYKCFNKQLKNFKKKKKKVLLKNV